MNSATTASRAVLAAYASKTLRPIEIIAVIIFIVSLLIAAYLISTISLWWWLLMIVVIAYGVIGSSIWFIIHFTIDKLRPRQTTEQQAAVSSFIESIDKVADTIGLTKFGLLLRIISDVLGRRNKNVISEFARDSKSLKDEFTHLISLF